MNTLSLNQQARLTGIFYLLVVVTGIFSLMYVPAQTIVLGDPAQTVANIKEKELLFRFGVVSSLLCYFFFFFVGWSAYKLLKKVNENIAGIMFGLVLCSIPIAVYGVHNLTYILSLLFDSRYSVGSGQEVEYRVMSAILSYGRALSITDLFWSSWLFPFGFLIYRSAFLPKFLGILLMIGSIAYFTYFFGNILFPDIDIIKRLRVPARIAEIGTCIWLVIGGIKKSG